MTAPENVPWITQPPSLAHALGEAIRYALTRWDGLSRFLDDGRVDLDSNTVERSIRPLALKRAVDRSGLRTPLTI